jgi:hypothetical protein
MGLGALSPHKNTSKTAVPAAELPITPGFSTAFSTVVEILGEKPKAFSVTWCASKSNGTGECSIGKSHCPNQNSKKSKRLSKNAKPGREGQVGRD